MTFADILEILVCLLAVYGVYDLLCHTLAFLCPKADLSVGVHLGEESGNHAMEDLRYAVILTEEHRGQMRPPVFLLDESIDEKILASLREEGCEIYRRID